MKRGLKLGILHSISYRRMTSWPFWSELDVLRGVGFEHVGCEHHIVNSVDQTRSDNLVEKDPARLVLDVAVPLGGKGPCELIECGGLDGFASDAECCQCLVVEVLGNTLE